MSKTKGAPSPGRIALALTIAAGSLASSSAWAQSASGTLSSFQAHFGGSSLSSLEQPFNATTSLAFTAGLVGTYPQTTSSTTPVTGAGDSYSGVGGDGSQNNSGGYPAGSSRQNSNDGSANTALNGKVNLNGGQ